jgi:hypothetical protein
MQRIVLRPESVYTAVTMTFRTCHATARRFRTALTWCVTLVFAAIVVPGQGLHLLPGMAHDCCSESGGLASAGLSSPLGAISVGWQKQDARHVGHDDACPVCQFFAHGNVVLSQSTVVAAYLPATSCVAFSFPSISQREYLPFSARGPPQG